MEYKVLKFLREVVDRGELKDITLVAGEEEYLIKTLIEKIKSLYEHRILWGDELSLDKLKTETSVGGMFVSQKERVCIVYRAQDFFKSLNKSSLEGFLKFLSSGPGSKIVFVMEVKLSKKDLGKEPVKTISKLGDVVLSEKLSREKIMDMVRKKFSREGEGIEEEAIELLIRTTGANLMLLKYESEKLIDYTGGRKVTAEDVRRVCIPYTEFTVFEFIDAFLGDELEKALETLKSLNTLGISPLQLQALLASYVSKIYLLHTLLGSGESMDSAFTKLGINHPFMKAKFKNYLQRQGRRLRERLIEELYRLDKYVKTLYSEPERALEEFTIRSLLKS